VLASRRLFQLQVACECPSVERFQTARDRRFRGYGLHQPARAVRLSHRLTIGCGHADGVRHRLGSCSAWRGRTRRHSWRSVARGIGRSERVINLGADPCGEGAAAVGAAPPYVSTIDLAARWRRHRRRAAKSRTLPVRVTLELVYRREPPRAGRPARRRTARAAVPSVSRFLVLGLETTTAFTPDGFSFHIAEGHLALGVGSNRGRSPELAQRSHFWENWCE